MRHLLSVPHKLIADHIQKRVHGYMAPMRPDLGPKWHRKIHAKNARNANEMEPPFPRSQQQLPVEPRVIHPPDALCPTWHPRYRHPLKEIQRRCQF